MSSPLTSKRRRFPADLDELQEALYSAGWTDGLPVIPPTEERVSSWLAQTGYAPDAVIAGPVAPSVSVATAEKVAINAVMAGCLPSYMPVIAAALRGVCDERFNLSAIQTTTHPVAPLIIANGQIRGNLGINCGTGLFGPGTRANATIGRALRLILMNVGGAVPGSIDRATLGQPSKYSFCIGENEEESPWNPLSVERGFEPGEDVVTVFGAESPHNINDHRSKTAEELLLTVSSTMATAGNNNVLVGGEYLLVLSPEHAATVAGSGFSLADIRTYVFENARLDIKRIAEPNLEIMRIEDGRALILESPDRLLVMVGGGPGKHSMCLPTFMRSTTSISERVLDAGGEPLIYVCEI